ncbi:hypothetical protein TRVL_00908 [Trypanosoma vivax]|nr:hypothetical protein TRVL_00908 [Trypanosoma vivax]
MKTTPDRWLILPSVSFRGGRKPAGEANEITVSEGHWPSPGEAKRPQRTLSGRYHGGWRGGGDRRGSARQHRRLAANEVVRMLPCTRGRAALEVRRRRLLISGDAERSPDAPIRGARWNSGGLSRVKRVALERKLREDMFLLRLFQETRLGRGRSANGIRIKIPFFGAEAGQRSRQIPPRFQGRKNAALARSVRNKGAIKKK